MTRAYSTEAIVFGSRKLGEADRIVELFTSERGRVPTVVKGIRKVGSRWGGRLEPFTLIAAQLHEGRTLHTLTGADTISTHVPVRDSQVCLKAGLSVAEMVIRSTPELHPKPRTWNLLKRFLDVMDGVCTGASTQTMGPPVTIALSTQLKILLLAGFLPHLLDCASCGSEVDLPRFSAEAGGALCERCGLAGFPVSEASLAGMRELLEKPLSEAAVLQLDDLALKQIRRAIREICEYHLGVRLRVEPW